MTRVLLTGCTGEVGSRLTKMLMDLGFEVFGIRGSRNCEIREGNHTCKKVDLLDSGSNTGLKEIYPEILVHTAWLAKPGEFWQSQQNLHWLVASKRLISEFSSMDGRYLVVTGTCAEYSWDTFDTLGESSLEQPSSIYGQAKLELLNWIHRQRTPYLWTRTFFQFGMNEPKGRLIPSLIDSLHLERKFVVNHGNDVRDFVFVEDVARVLALLISREEKGIVNIGSGQSIEVARVSRLIAELFNRPDLLKIESSQEQGSFVVSQPRKLNTIIGKFDWSPLETALIRSIEARKP